jgi:hypothetical protein
MKINDTCSFCASCCGTEVDAIEHHQAEVNRLAAQVCFIFSFLFIVDISTKHAHQINSLKLSVKRTIIQQLDMHL